MKTIFLLACAVALSGCDVATREEHAADKRGQFLITQYTAVAGMPNIYTADYVVYGNGNVAFTDKESGRQYVLLGTVEVVRR